jgi:pyridoxal phosphate enzyme (YggS family)
MRQIRDNVAAACQRAGRETQEVTLVAVVKSAEVDDIKTLIELGQTHFGESRVQQLVERREQIDQWVATRRNKPQLHWHMIGHLQRNKVKQALGAAQLVHSVDSLRLAEDINARAEAAEIVQPVLLQVNCSQEQQKYGVAVGAATHLAEMICTLRNLRLSGLMTMAPLVDSAELARPAFARLRELFEEMRSEKIGGSDLRHLSMGMSQDYAVAVEEGATLIRVGSAIFSQ